MRTAKISELKAKLSAHINYVKSGEEVLILDRNTPVAKLVSAGPFEEYGERERRLIAKGVLTTPKSLRNRARTWPLPAGPMVSQEAIDRMCEERDDR